MALTLEERERYSRQILPDIIGEAGQTRLKDARVLVVGAGGLGCPVLQYLTGAGVGKIGIIDYDVVETSNLHRQVLFGSSSIEQNKAKAAAVRLGDLNPLIDITPYPIRLTSKNARKLFEGFDLIVDGSDSVETRLLIDSAARATGKPWVYGAIHKFEGQVSVFNHRGGPCYGDVFPQRPSAVRNCAEIGVLGVLPALVGSRMAAEALKVILDIGESLCGKLLMINALNNESELIQIGRTTEQNPHGDQNRTVTDTVATSGADIHCTTGSEIKEISAEELFDRLGNGLTVEFLDVREHDEMPKIDRLRGYAIPAADLASVVDLLPRHTECVVYCQSGVRSRYLIAELQNRYGYDRLLNLTGGVEAWIMIEKSENERVYA